MSLNNTFPLALLAAFGGMAMSSHLQANVPDAQFAAPSSEFRVVRIWNGNAITKKRLPQILQEMNAGGIVLSGQYPRPKPPDPEKKLQNPAYMNNPVMFENFRSMLQELKNEDLNVWIYDELGYPSASAGGRVLEGHPEYAAQGVRCRTYVSDGAAVEIAPKGDSVVACQAFQVNDGVLNLESRIDLTEQARAGVFTWQSPSKDWKVLVFERWRCDAWKRHNMKREIPNIMDRAAVARFMELTHQRFAAELGEQHKDIFLYFTDEPQLAVVEPWGDKALEQTLPAVEWSGELPSLFEGNKGYPITEALPALFNNVGPMTAKYRYDFKDMTSDLIAENYYGQIQDWCHANDVYSSGHMLLEESLLFHPMFTGSMLKNWTRQDLPGVDQIILSRYKTMGGWDAAGTKSVQEDFSIKMAASIRTFHDKPGVFSESFAVCHISSEKDDLFKAAKGMIAWQFYAGVTHMGTLTLQEHISAADYATLADYSGRIALLMRRGQAVSDVAVLVPEASIWALYNPPTGGRMAHYFECNPEAEQVDHGFRETCYQLSSSQRDFEILTEALLQQAVVSGDRLELAGQSFAFLMLPEARMLSDESMQKIEAFAAAGGRVVFTGSLPSMSPAIGQDASMSARAQALLCDQVKFVADDAQLGEVVTWMDGVLPPVLEWHGSKGVRLAHQREAGRDIIMLANPSNSDAEGELVCALKGNASIWNPETGEIEQLGASPASVAIQISIPSDSARFVLFELLED